MGPSRLTADALVLAAFSGLSLAIVVYCLNRNTGDKAGPQRFIKGAVAGGITWVLLRLLLDYVDYRAFTWNSILGGICWFATSLGVYSFAWNVLGHAARVVGDKPEPTTAPGSES